MRGLEWSRQGECNVGKCMEDSVLTIKMFVRPDPLQSVEAAGQSCGKHVGELAKLLRNDLASRLAVIADKLDPVAVSELPHEGGW